MTAHGISNTIGKSSEIHYKNTLYSFFDYYISKGNEYKVYGLNEFSPLEEISSKDFVQYLKTFKSATRKANGKIPKTKCAAISTMYEVLEKNGCIRINNMKDVLERAKNEFGESKENLDNSISNLLSEDSINKILLELKDKPNKAIIFILAGYYGFDRNSIVNFLSGSWQDIDFEKHIFMWKGKKYPLVSLFEEYLKRIKEDYKKKGIKKPSAIYMSKKTGVYEPIKGGTVSGVFDEIKKINGETEWGLFNLQNTRGSLIYKMFKHGCSLEEISYLTDSPISQIVKYIPDDLIYINGYRSWNTGKNKHPFNKIFDNKK